MNLAAWLQREWYAQRRPSPALWLLLPAHALFVLLSGLRRWAYRVGLLASARLPVPVVVVGNLIAGGAGKTPLVLWLAKALRERGYRPGIVSRGYGVPALAPREVSREATAAEVGDEPLLLARRADVPVWIGRDRVKAGQGLLAAHPDIDIVVADDGLQHYRLVRDGEVIVFDARGAGNGWRLPIGPLREPLRRVARATAIVCNGGPVSAVATGDVPAFAMELQPADFYRLENPAVVCDAAALRGQPLHAVAGIGDPARFFRTLEGLGLEFTPHPFPDHHVYKAVDLDFGAGAVLLMTEKDAVKCAGLTAHPIWVLPVEARLSAALVDTLLEKLNGR